ncbi:5'-nucleotidase [Seminavis robusta]|uniref:5'-nucleotidase n=1 Tax=Seminavis robusta TaxID=568900 RepID=A0A9N8E759_9STRA|nr:5'-nucleotidase [Seminavis robusta]|eukprot:Sro752_g197180.1 5'-nucleotidase (760) ;mRNA; f:24053-26332
MRSSLSLHWKPSSLVASLYICAILSIRSFPLSLAETTTVTNVDLPFGDINVLVLTDVHSWVGGHSSSAPDNSNNVDYGDVLSFYQLLHAHCQQHEMDLWFVVNGDWIDGTGISLNDDTSYLTPILEHMPWDALNVGNHELYRDEVVTQFMRPGGFVEWWGDRYVSSNVIYNPHQQPLGERYRFLRGKNSTVLTFGFLYNMQDASSLVTVETVESVVEEPWFVDVVTNANNEPTGDYDAILIMAHMDVKDELVTVLLDKIRSLVGDHMPVQFLTGHTHFRRIETLDAASVSFEAGKFLDTIGFVSFPKKQTLTNHRRSLQGNSNETTPLLGPGGTEWQNVSDPTTAPSISNDTTTTTSTSTATTGAPIATTNANTTTSMSAPSSRPTEAATPSPTPLATANRTVPPVSTPQPTVAPTPVVAKYFHHRFIDTNVATLKQILGDISDEQFTTEDGRRLSEFILRTRTELGLLDVVGCSPESYYMNRTAQEDDSLWRLFIDQVAPYELLKPSKSGGNRVYIGQVWAFRYDLLQQQLVKDDVIAVAPFNDSLISIGPNIPGSVVTQLVKQVLNPSAHAFNPKWENYYLAPRLETLAPNEQYEILSPSFGIETIVSGLDEIGYNGTTKQQDSGFFDTDVWIKFVKDNWECRDQESVAPTSTNQHHGGSQGHGNAGSGGHQGGSSSTSSSGPGDHNHHSGTPYNVSANEEEDKFRLILASIGVGLVLLLGTVYIWQLHKSWLVRYRERQRLIFIADSENDPDNELI